MCECRLQAAIIFSSTEIAFGVASSLLRTTRRPPDVVRAEYVNNCIFRKACAATLVTGPGIRIAFCLNANEYDKLAFAMQASDFLFASNEQLSDLNASTCSPPFHKTGQPVNAGTFSQQRHDKPGC